LNLSFVFMKSEFNFFSEFKKYIDKAIDDSKYAIPVEFMTPELEK